MPTLNASERIGSVIGGRYRLKNLIGEGGFSSVFQAVHEVTGGEVAIKLLHSHLVTTRQITERFLMEARSMARIRHDGIVQVFDAGEDPDGTVFIALELLAGEPLEQTLIRVGRLTWDETVSIGVDVLSALGEAHRHNIIHRDIKPGNIFIVRKSDGSSLAKLLDFGIAHVARGTGSRITEKGMILGTPEYMSPEQSRSATVGPEADLWSVGIVLFECLAGYTPFVAETTTEVLLKVATTRAPLLSEIDPSVPPSIAEVIDHALAREAAGRYRSADEMRTALLEARDLADRAREAARPAPAPSALYAHTPLHGTPRLPGSGANPTRQEFPEDLEVPLPERLGTGGTPANARTSSAGRGNALARQSAPTMAALDTDTVQRPAAGYSTPEPSGRSSGEVGGEFDPELVPRRNVPFGEMGTVGNNVAEDFPVRNASGVRSRGSESSGRGGATASAPDGSAGAPDALNPRAQRQFQAPPSTGKLPAVIAGAVVVLGLLGGALWLRDDPAANTTPPPPPPVTPDAGPESPEPPHAPEGSLQQASWIRLPGSVTGADDASAFARHVTASAVTGRARHVLATCVPSREGGGAFAFLYQLQGGASLPSSRGAVRCEGYDMAVVPDLTGDGTDDVVAVTPDGEGLVLLNSQTMEPARVLPLPKARGVVSGPVVRGEPTVVVYTEPGGVAAASVVVALGLQTGTQLWVLRAEAPMGRLGHPVELGLVLGPDATGDGVPDVVMGLGPVTGANPETVPARARCVQLVSGADGRLVWPQPFCQVRGRGSQSVSLGPDLNGDGRGDLAVGTDQPVGGDPPVVVLSGADARVLRSLEAPTAGNSGFGWPVVLSGDINGDGTPELLVGTVGNDTGVALFNATTGVRLAAQTLGAGATTLRLLATASTVPSGPWSMVVANPTDGIHTYFWGQPEL